MVEDVEGGDLSVSKPFVGKELDEGLGDGNEELLLECSVGVLVELVMF